jgi:hypothetical protein
MGPPLSSAPGRRWVGAEVRDDLFTGERVLYGDLDMPGEVRPADQFGERQQMHSRRWLGRRSPRRRLQQLGHLFGVVVRATNQSTGAAATRLLEADVMLPVTAQA